MIGSPIIDAESSWFHGNVAEGNGGGIAVESDGTNLPSLTVDGALGDEGCLPAENFRPAVDEYCSEFRENVAGGYGGGLYLEAGATSVNRTAFIANDAGTEAFALGLRNVDNPSLRLKNALVVDHSAGAGQSVIIAGNSTTLDAEHVTVTANTGTPVRYTPSSAGSFLRSIVWDTSNFLVDSPNSINAACTSFNNVTGTTTGANRAFILDPIFDATPRGNYRLDPTSPERDVCNNGLANDLDSDTRPVNVLYDRGAFEYQ